MSKHLHDWRIVITLPYRDIDRTKYMQDIYTCECGAGYFIRTPKAMYTRGYRFTKKGTGVEHLVDGIWVPSEHQTSQRTSTSNHKEK